jgi:putative N6-adenine-specific DNA methylase
MTDLFAICTPGLEQVLLAEVLGLPGVARARAVPGGVELSGPMELVGLANLHLRSASRVLLRLARFQATKLPQLIEATAAVPWERYLRSAAARPSVTARRCRIYHSAAAAERLIAGIAARLGQRAGRGRASVGSHDGHGAGVYLRGENDAWELSLDTSGELLHRRGYRREATPAPLRETLAAGLLLHAGYQGGPLLDLCCGSGTFAIEAALLRRRIAPGLGRRFACEDWPDFDAARFAQQREEARAQVLPRSEVPQIGGIDLDPQAVQAGQHNAARAGVAEEIRLLVADLFHPGRYAALLDGLDRATALIVANPPYGKRLDGSPFVFYRRLGRHLLWHFAGCAVLILCPDPHTLPLPLAGLPLRNGGVRITAFSDRLLGPEELKQRGQDRAGGQQTEEDSEGPGEAQQDQPLEVGDQEAAEAGHGRQRRQDDRPAGASQRLGGIAAGGRLGPVPVDQEDMIVDAIADAQGDGEQVVEVERDAQEP